MIRVLFAIPLALVFSACWLLAEIPETPTPEPAASPSATAIRLAPTPTISGGTLAPQATPVPPRGTLGLYIASVDSGWRRLLGLSAEPGAVVVTVVPGSPAARAGIMERDVVVSLDDKPVRSAQELQRRLPKPIGASVRLTVIRAGQRLNLVGATAPGQSIEALEDNALGEARAKAQASPDDPIMLYRLSLLLPLQEAEAAIEHLNRAIVIAPDFAAAYLERAGRWTDLYLAAQRAGPQPATSPFFLPALDDYTATVELEPELWEAFSDRSNFFYLTQEYALAAADGLRLTELDPEEPRSWTRVGWGVYGLRRFVEAEEAFLQALQLDPEQEEAHFGLARVYREQTPSDNGKSVAAYRNVLRYSFNEARRSEAITWIELLMP